MLLPVVGGCCTKFKSNQTFESTTPSFSFVSSSLKRNATMLDPFAQHFGSFSLHIHGLLERHSRVLCHSITKSYRSYPSHNTLQYCCSPILLAVGVSLCFAHAP